MGLRLQINPSTLKIPFEATNKKVLMWNNICSACGAAKTPTEIQVTFSGIGQICKVAGLRSWKAWLSNINDVAFTCTHDGYYLSPYDPCKWGFQDMSGDGDYGYHRWYLDEIDCTGSYNEYDWTQMYITVERNISGLDVGLHLHTNNLGGCTGTVWISTLITPESGYCTKITSVGPSSVNCGLSGGNVSIIESVY